MFAPYYLRTVHVPCICLKSLLLTQDDGRCAPLSHMTHSKATSEASSAVRINPCYQYFDVQVKANTQATCFKPVVPHLLRNSVRNCSSTSCRGPLSCLAACRAASSAAASPVAASMLTSQIRSSKSSGDALGSLRVPRGSPASAVLLPRCHSSSMLKSNPDRFLPRINLGFKGSDVGRLVDGQQQDPHVCMHMVCCDCCCLYELCVNWLSRHAHCRCHEMHKTAESMSQAHETCYEIEVSSTAAEGTRWLCGHAAEAHVQPDSCARTRCWHARLWCGTL